MPLISIFQNFIKLISENQILSGLVVLAIGTLLAFGKTWLKRFYQSTTRIFLNGDTLDEIQFATSHYMEQPGLMEYKDEPPTIPNIGTYLFDRLRDSEDHTKVTLIIAPSGYGKTTLLAKLAFRYQQESKGSVWPWLVCLHCNELFKSEATSKLEQLFKEKTIDEKDRSKTLLLIDGFDEIDFEFEKNASHDEYKKKIQLRWEALMLATSKFGKIVITVREQIFDTLKLEPIDTGDISEYQKIKKIRVQPLNEETLKQFINKLVVYEKNEPFTERWTNLKRWNPVLAEVFYCPLIASYIRTVLVDNHVHQSMWDVLHPIAEKWLSRESDEKVSYEREILINFCINLAKKTREGGGEISAEELSEEERNVVFNKTEKKRKNLQNRTLLVRSRENTFKFTNQLFAEYFLVYDLFKARFPSPSNGVNLKPFSPEETEQLNRFDSRGLEYAYHLIFGARWKEARPVAKEVQLKPGSGFLLRWDSFFKALFPDGPIAEIYRRDFFTYLPPTDLEKFFTDFERLHITKSNLIKQIKEETAEDTSLLEEPYFALAYFNDWVVSIDLKDAHLKNQDILSVLKYSGNSLKRIILRDSDIKTGRYLETFKIDALGNERLRELDFSEVALSSSQFQPFKSLNNLVQLDVSATGLQASDLNSLRISKEMFLLGLNKIKFDSKTFAHFKGAKNLVYLDLRETNLTYSDLRELSISEEMYCICLRGIRMTPESFAPFKKAMRLEYLDIRETGLKAIDLKGLVILESIKWVLLEGIALKSHDFDPFKKLKKLTSLNVSNTGLFIEDLNEINFLPETVGLELGGIKISEEQFKRFGNFKALNRIDLSFTGLSGRALANLGFETQSWRIRLAGVLMDIDDLQPLHTIQETDHLDLSYTDLPGKKLLQKLHHIVFIQEIFLAGLQGFENDFSWFLQRPMLETINVAGTDIADLSFCMELPKLKRLHVAKDQIKDLGQIDQLRSKGVEVVFDSVL